MAIKHYKNRNLDGKNIFFMINIDNQIHLKFYLYQYTSEFLSRDFLLSKFLAKVHLNTNDCPIPQIQSFSETFFFQYFYFYLFFP